MIPDGNDNVNKTCLGEVDNIDKFITIEYTGIF